MHLATENGHIGVVEQLLGKGSSVGAMDEDNSTPLRLAAKNVHTGTVQLLKYKAAGIVVPTSKDTGDNESEMDASAWCTGMVIGMG